MSLQFEYSGGTDVVQMRFLRLNSRFSTQTISYYCRPVDGHTRREREVKFLADTRTQSYLAALQDCVVSARDCDGEHGCKDTGSHSALTRF